MLLTAEQPAGGDDHPRLPKLKDEPGSRPFSDRHQEAQAHPDAVEIFTALAEARALLYRTCAIPLHEAVDILQLRRAHRPRRRDRQPTACIPSQIIVGSPTQNGVSQ
jgi:hypothetical protein